MKTTYLDKRKKNIYLQRELKFIYAYKSEEGVVIPGALIHDVSNLQRRDAAKDKTGKMSYPNTRVATF